jgi:hypothetical protein
LTARDSLIGMPLHWISEAPAGAPLFGRVRPMGILGGSAGQANELSGFGFPESPTAVEACQLNSCYHNSRPFITDLYCPGHGRFLPLIRVPVTVRSFAAIFFSLFIYGAFELTAQTGSRTPVYLVYSMIFLCFAAIPLRHFPRTAIVTSLIWVFGSLMPVISRVTADHFHVIMAAVIVVGAAAVLADCAIADTSSIVAYRTLGWDYQVIVRLIAAALIVAAWSAFVGVLVRYSAHVLPGAESGLSTVALIVALICVAIGALIMGVSGMVLGVGRVRTQVPRITNPGRPAWVPPNTRSPGARAYQAQNALDIMIETFTRILYLIVVTVGNALVIIGRVAAHCIALGGYALARAIIAVTNFLIRVAVLTARWARAAVVVSARMSWYAVMTACRGMADSIVGVLVPACALFGTPWLVLAMAGQSRQYLRHGSIEALGLLIALLLVVSALLLGAWVILANQHPRESFRSAGRSIPITVGYGLVVLLMGGLLLGIAGEFGYGPIRLGVITFALLGVAVMAVVLRRTGRRAGRAASAPVPGPPAYSGRRWSVAVSLAMVAGTVIGLAAFPPPWTGTSVGPATGFTVRAAVPASHSRGPRTATVNQATSPPASAGQSQTLRTPAPKRAAPATSRPVQVSPSSTPVRASPSSFPITYPGDMTTACAQQFGQGAYAQLASESIPSYDVVCVVGGQAYTGLNLDAFCPWLAQQLGYQSPNGPDGWWSGNPERYDQNTSDQPWLDWRCYNSENRP